MKQGPLIVGKNFSERYVSKYPAPSAPAWIAVPSFVPTSNPDELRRLAMLHQTSATRISNDSQLV